MKDITREDMIQAGWDLAELDAIKADGFWFHSVDVMEPCECGNCAADRRWFYCNRLNDRYIASYAVIADGMPRDNNDGVKSIWEKHPGKVLIY